MKTNTKYQKEIQLILNGMKEDENSPKNIEYFIEQLEKHHLRTKKNEDEVYLFGASIPEELIRGMGLKPIWVLGGSYQAGLMAEDTFPRDVDPVVKSSYGFFKYITQEEEKAATVIIPYHNDSFRKLSWLMASEGTTVINMDIPSVKEMTHSRDMFYQSTLRLIKEMEKLFDRTLKPYKLYEACKEIGNAKERVQTLLKLCEENPSLLTSTTLYGIVSAYYSAEDLKEYKVHLDIVIDELKNRQCSRNNNRPKIWLLGSPLFFPNNKLLSMGEALSSDIALYGNEMTMFFKPCVINYENSRDDQMRAIANHYFELNRMPLNVEEHFKMESPHNQRQGVIFHLLKGEVAYDYDLLKVESYFKKGEIPVLRVETDYSPEDKEQLKIRVEAFVEMLRQYV